MTVSRKHTLYAVGLFTDLMGGEVVLDGVTRQSLTSGKEYVKDPTSGNVYSRFVAQIAEKPTGEFATKKIATALDNIGLTGLAIASTTNYGVKIIAQKYAEGAARTSGSAHRQYLLQEGIIVPRRLTVDHRGDAELTYEILLTYDGTNDPVVESDSVALLTLGGDAERYTLGDITIGGVALTGVKRLDIDFGITAVSEGADSDLFDTLVHIEDIQPVITLRGIDQEWLKAANIPRAGKAAAHADTTIFLRKRADGGIYTADVTEEHIKITAAGLAGIDTIFDASQGSGAEQGLVLHTQHDETNTPLVFDTASAIS